MHDSDKVERKKINKLKYLERENSDESSNSNAESNLLPPQNNKWKKLLQEVFQKEDDS